ncbi:GFA family protein [Massilia sp. S19_KUP03_FR1]|uniref:GFA family protein n=1 Tax=Massilia sp. S19_KUP03_FR1 TaxID=3025503 RepID=UPI002FCD9911
MPLFDLPSDVLRGACLCGAVAYRAKGPLFCTSHCYCSQCQRQHGIAGSYGNVHAAGFCLELGAGLITEFAKSSAGRCGFCSVCGSMLYWRGAATPERVAVALGTLQPAWTGSVEHELFAQQKPAWLPPG